ncbi:hypothetical protein L4F91_04725 [Avibacterium sp. 20-126]|nr:hypothetical protein L4F91_04725 [Avibacterium sp. 20-126]
MSAGTPMFKVLPKGARKAVFYVPEAVLAQFPVGRRVRVSGDGVGQLTAAVDKVAVSPEYAPPMLYDERSRGSLRFRVEATLLGTAADVVPFGLPVSVEAEHD